MTDKAKEGLLVVDWESHKRKKHTKKDFVIQQKGFHDFKMGLRPGSPLLLYILLNNLM